MRKWVLLFGLLLTTQASAEMKCFYEKLPNGIEQQICFDLSKPADVTRYRAYLYSITPRAGLFDADAPLREMQTNPILKPPTSLKPFLVQEMKNDLIIRGILEGSSNEIILAGVTTIPGQEQALARALQSLLPIQSVPLIETTGNWRRGRPDVFLWLGGSLIQVILVERGLATPIPGNTRYQVELEVAQAFAEQNKLGSWAEVK